MATFTIDLLSGRVLLLNKDFTTTGSTGGGLPVSTFNSYTGDTSTTLGGLRTDVNNLSGSTYTDAEARAAVAKFPTQIFRFLDTGSTFQYTQAEDFKINTIVAQTGVTVTIKLSDGTTNYVLGATVNSFDYLIFSVDVVGSFKINAEIL